MDTHERVWERTESRRPSMVPEWKPRGTYTLLGAMGGVFLLQLIALAVAQPFHRYGFVIDTDWLLRPWVLVTSTLAHGSLSHILFNGLVLYFFGPIAERILGRKRFLLLFFIAGAVAGVLQAHLSGVMHAMANDLPVVDALIPWQDAAGGGALGASGALMFVLGFLIVLMPNQTLLLFFVIPVPFWLAGVLFAFLDIVGAFDASDGIGNFAHLAGMAIGLLYGFRFKGDMRARGMRLAY